MRKAFLITVLLALSISLPAGPLDAGSRAGAVLTVPEAEYGFDYNPALLAYSGGLMFSLPVGIRLGHPSDLVQSGLLSNIGDTDALTESALEYLRSFSGQMEALGASESLGLVIHGFGLQMSFDQRLETESGSIAINFIPILEADFTIGIGHRWDFENWTLATGLSVRKSILFETSPIGVHSVTGFILDPSSWGAVESRRLEESALCLGLHASLPAGFLAASTLSWSDAGFLASSAIGWQGSISILSLSLELGLENWNRVASLEDFLRSINAGATLGLTSHLAISAGLDSGLPSAGIRLSLSVFRLSLAWLWHDYGVIRGLAPRDSLELEVSIFID